MNVSEYEKINRIKYLEGCESALKVIYIWMLHETAFPNSPTPKHVIKLIEKYLYIPGK